VFNPEMPRDEIRWLNTLTDCEIYYDEGQWLLDSYQGTDVSVNKRKLITETGHNNRKIVIIAQRTQSVHVNARGNVNIFWKCKKDSFFFIPCFMVYEFQDMVGQDVDENSEPVSQTRYWSNSFYWGMFNTHYLRAGKPVSQSQYDAMVAAAKAKGIKLPAAKPVAKTAAKKPVKKAAATVTKKKTASASMASNKKNK